MKMSFRRTVEVRLEAARRSVDGPLTFPANTREGPSVYLGALTAAGFRMDNGRSLPTVWGSVWGSPIELNMMCEIDRPLDPR